MELFTLSFIPTFKLGPLRKGPVNPPVPTGGLFGNVTVYPMVSDTLLTISTSLFVLIEIGRGSYNFIRNEAGVVEVSNNAFTAI